MNTSIPEMEARIIELETALRRMRDVAQVSIDGDSWYAENAGLDTVSAFAQARKALGEKPREPGFWESS